MFKFKKVASVLTSAAMLTSTIALAAATTFPAPFVRNGVADVAIVYGAASPASVDVAAATDIAASLNTALQSQTSVGAVTTPTSTSTTTVSGTDFVKIEKTRDKFNLGNKMSTLFGATVDKDDLKVLLADGTYLNDENTEYKYEQTFTLYPLELAHFARSSYKNREPTVGFRLPSNTKVLNYTLDFTTDAESDVSSGKLVDFQATTINMMGKDYFILEAINTSSNSSYIGKLKLLDAGVQETIKEGETKTIKAGNKEYTVKVDLINQVTSSSTVTNNLAVRLIVNGRSTGSMRAGDTFKMSDGSRIGIKEIGHGTRETSVSFATITIGSGEIELQGNGELVKINGEEVKNVHSWILRGTPSGGREKIDKIILQWSTNEESFITPESSLTMPGFGSVKIAMSQFIRPKQEKILVEADGDDSIVIKAPLNDGDATINILGADSNGNFTLIGKDENERLATSKSGSLIYRQTFRSDDYHKKFVATYKTTDEAESYLLSASISESDGRNRTTIKNELTGRNICEGVIAGRTCSVGSVTLNIVDIGRNSTDKWVNISAGSNVVFDKLYTKEGLMIQLPFEYNSSEESPTRGAIDFNNDTIDGHSKLTYRLFFTEENKDEDKAAGSSFNITLGHYDKKVQVSDIDTGSAKYQIPGGSNSDVVSLVVSDLATEVKRIVVSNRGRAEINYAGSQAYADVMISSADAISSGGSSGGGTGTGSVERGQVISVADSDTALYAGKNLIVVGGSCVNRVAAQLLGADFPACGSEWQSRTAVGPSQFLIKTFSHQDKVATLVAGWDTADTRNAATALRTQPNMDTRVGAEYRGSAGSTTATLITAGWS